MTQDRKEYQRKYRQKNKARMKECKKKWYQENREHCLKSFKDNRLKNLERYRQKDREYHNKNKSKKVKQSKEWKKNNPERTRQLNRKSYFRIAHGDLAKEAETLQDLKLLLRDKAK